jgi:formate dehydrogenase major subunit
VTDAAAHAAFEREWAAPFPRSDGWHLTEMFDAMERKDLTSVFVIGENPAQSEADVARARALLAGLDHLVVLDIHLTKTAELAEVVLPGSASWCESDGTVTNSERRVQRVRKALAPPGNARDDIDILLDVAARLGHRWTYGGHEDIWNELRRLSPMHAGMSWERLERLGGIQWPCYRDDELEPPFLHGRLWADDPELRGSPAPFSVVVDDPPVEDVSDDFPLRLTTGRRLDSYNTGVQSGGYSSPTRLGETIDVSVHDADALGLVTGEIVRVSSARGAVDAPVRIDRSLRSGLVFMTFHFPDEVDVNQLTIDATDPKSGTAEFKAAAVRIDKLDNGVPR